MRAWRKIIVAIAFAATLAPSAHGQPTNEADDPARQILVMVRLTPEHYRPGADAGGGYGDSLSRSARRRMAGRIARAHGLRFVDDWPMPLLALDCLVMAVPDGRPLDAVASEVSRDDGVAWSQPARFYHAQSDRGAHNDPLFPTQPAARAWRLADLHQLATGRGVSIAVIDSRIERAHPDLAGQVAVAQDFAPGHGNTAEWHGTGVAGIIAATADNGLGIAGIAPGARLLALRACWQLPASATTLCDTLSLAKALDFAIGHSAQVINLSLGGPPDRLLAQFLQLALARRIAVVAAYDRTLPGGGFPASYPGVIAVAPDRVAALPIGVYSAPGRDVPTTIPGGRWDLVDGSSFAAAHVSGLMALVRERGRGSSDARKLVVSAEGGIDSCATLLGAGEARDCRCAHASAQVAAAR